MTMINYLFKVSALCLVGLLLGLAVLSGGMTDKPATVPVFAPAPVTVPRAIPRATDHTLNHEEGSTVQIRYTSGMCDTVLAFYSLSMGKLLFLCAVPQTDMFGGLVFKITENMGATLLGDEAYQVTVFVMSKAEWNWVIKRDGYRLFSGYITLQGLVKQRWPGLYW